VRRAVWSFWSRPFQATHRELWRSERHHLLAWIISVETARRHYPETALYTDSGGARLLVDRLGLQFDHVSLLLDGIDGRHPGWWNLGKLYAYRAQEAPFLHLDSDVFLWSPLPALLQTAGVAAQNWEEFEFGSDASWYQPVATEAAVRAVGGWLPEEWTWQTRRQVGRALCCGILGGHSVDFIRHYADLAIRIMEHPDNLAAWLGEEDRYATCVLFEQFLLGACLDFHRGRPGSPFADVDVHCLFATAADSWTPEAARRVGYTHLIGAAKRDPILARRLEARVRRDHPEHHERICRLFPAEAPVAVRSRADPAGTEARRCA
jgi:hypothetical protein